MIRTNRPYMVTPTVIAELAKGKVNSNFNTLDYGTDCYEAGIKDVLRGIAIQELDNGPDIFNPERVTKLLKDYTEKQVALQATLNSAELVLLKEFEESCSQLNAGECEEYFMAGFISGYRFLKHINLFHSI